MGGGGAITSIAPHPTPHHESTGVATDDKLKLLPLYEETVVLEARSHLLCCLLPAGKPCLHLNIQTLPLTLTLHVCFEVLLQDVWATTEKLQKPLEGLPGRPRLLLLHRPPPKNCVWTTTFFRLTGGAAEGEDPRRGEPFKGAESTTRTRGTTAAASRC